MNPMLWPILHKPTASMAMQMMATLRCTLRCLARCTSLISKEQCIRSTPKERRATSFSSRRLHQIQMIRYGSFKGLEMCIGD